MPVRQSALVFEAAGLVKPKLDQKGKPVKEIVDGEERIVTVPSRIFHDLRRLGVRSMVRAGVRETVAMAISGPSHACGVRSHNITSDDDLRQAVKQTQEHLSAQPTLRNVVAIGKKQ